MANKFQQALTSLCYAGLRESRGRFSLASEIQNCSGGLSIMVMFETDAQLRKFLTTNKTPHSVQVYGPRITVESLKLVAPLKTLRELHILGPCAITDRDFAVIEDMVNLKWLNLDGLPVTNVSLVFIRNLRGLNGLQLIGSKITNAGMFKLARLTRLQYLDLSGSSISNKAISQLAELKSLRSLRVNNTNLSNTGIVHFAAMKNLTTLSILHTKVSDQGLTWLKLYLPNCKVDAPSTAEWVRRAWEEQPQAGVY